MSSKFKAVVKKKYAPGQICIYMGSGSKRYLWCVQVHAHAFGCVCMFVQGIL